MSFVSICGATEKSTSTQVKTDPRFELMSIIFRMAGNPQFSGQVIPTVIHEFCHSYCNPQVDRHSSELQASGKEMVKRAEAAMRQMAYGGWLIMTRESLVRASVIPFLYAKFDKNNSPKGNPALSAKTVYEFGLNAEGYFAFTSETGVPLYPVLIRFKAGKAGKI